MFRYFRLKKEQPSERMPSGTLSGELLARDAVLPISIRQINGLPDNTRQRLYRCLLPPSLLMHYQTDPLTWEGKNGTTGICLKSDPDSGVVKATIFNPEDALEELLAIEIQDNLFDSIDLNLLLIGDPDSARFGTHLDPAGKPTLFGTVRRNFDEEQRAMQAGLAPGQTRKGLGSSRAVLDQLETFLAALGQRAYFLEPLTYTSAWIFERRGFAYVRGHKLMSDIQREFLPAGALYKALDGSTPFRQPVQWKSVRGRAWAIHDGILDVIGARWDQLRMIKQIGHHPSVETFPGSIY